MSFISLCSCLSLSLFATVFPRLCSFSPFFLSIISSIQMAVRRVVMLLSRYEIHHVGLSLSPYPSLTQNLFPPPYSHFFYQVIAVLISGHLRCQLTVGPVGINTSIRNIGLLALFMTLSVHVVICEEAFRSVHMLCSGSLHTSVFSLYFTQKSDDVWPVRRHTDGWMALVIDHTAPETWNLHFP